MILTLFRSSMGPTQSLAGSLRCLVVCLFTVFFCSFCWVLNDEMEDIRYTALILRQCLRIMRQKLVKILPALEINHMPYCYTSLPHLIITIFFPISLFFLGYAYSLDFGIGPAGSTTYGQLWCGLSSSQFESRTQCFSWFTQTVRSWGGCEEGGKQAGRKITKYDDRTKM